MTVINNLGEKIRKRRIELKLTQEKLAEISGLSINFISNIESNNQNISLKNLLILAESLQIDLSILLSEKDNNYQQSNYFLNKINQKINSLPEEQANSISKHIFYLLDETLK